MRFRRDRRVATSRTAVVYRSSRDGRAVAVKRLHAELAKDEAFVARFIREAEIAAKLDHPNLAEYIAVERGRGRVSLIIAWVDGVNLAEFVAAAPLSVELAVHVCTEILAGLDHLHAAGIVHRDVTPPNVLVSWDGQVRVTDFGIARDDALGFTTGLIIHGTLGYASPEQVDGEAGDARGDLFAAGVLLYQLLTGRSPFGDGVRYLANVSRGDVPAAPSALNLAVPAQLDGVVMRLLARRAAERYQSAREALADLPPCPAGRAELVGLLRQLRAAGGRSRSARVGMPRPGRLGRVGKGAALLGGMVALALAALWLGSEFGFGGPAAPARPSPDMPTAATLPTGTAEERSSGPGSAGPTPDPGDDALTRATTGAPDVVDDVAPSRAAQTGAAPAAMSSPRRASSPPSRHPASRRGADARTRRDWTAHGPAKVWREPTSP